PVGVRTPAAETDRRTDMGPAVSRRAATRACTRAGRSRSVSVTGHGRLSYRQAEALFHAASHGWTLHQLRHSALTHLAEANVALPLLMAKGPSELASGGLA